MIVQKLKNNNGLYIEINENYFTSSMLYMPIKVTVYELDPENKLAKIDQGWIEIDRLYSNEEDCPQR